MKGTPFFLVLVASALIIACSGGGSEPTPANVELANRGNGVHVTVASSSLSVADDGVVAQGTLAAVDSASSSMSVADGGLAAQGALAAVDAASSSMSVADGGSAAQETLAAVDAAPSSTSVADGGLAAQASLEPLGDASGPPALGIGSLAPSAVVDPTARVFAPPQATIVPCGRSVTGVASSNTPQPLQPGADAMTTRLAAASPGVPACSSSMHNQQGGSVIQNPHVNLVYWGNWSSQPYTAFWFGMANTPAFYTRLEEYGIQAGSFGQAFPTFSSGPTGSITETTLVLGLLAALGSYTPSVSDVFIIFLPSGTTSAYDVSHSAYGHHSSFTNNGFNYRFGVLESLSNQTTLGIEVSHELMETFTDPGFSTTGTGGRIAFQDNAGNEIGDLCNLVPTTIAALQVQKAWSEGACRCIGERDLGQGDVLASGLPDLTTFRPSQTEWFAHNFSPNWLFGASTDIPYVGDFNGDGRTEFALLRYGAPTEEFTLNIQTGIFNSFTFGQQFDYPVPGDYDNPPDGKTDLAVWQAADGWRFLSSATGQQSTARAWGISGDLAAQGDYDGDGITDFAVVRPSTGQWFVLPSSQPGTDIVATWDITNGDLPVPGDYNGDGKADWVYWRPSDGTWHVWYQNTNFAYTYQWGQNQDIPVARDYDGDWLADPTVWRPSNGTWFFTLSKTFQTSSTQWGAFGDFPMGEPAVP